MRRSPVFFIVISQSSFLFPLFTYIVFKLASRFVTHYLHRSSYKFHPINMLTILFCVCFFFNDVTSRRCKPILIVIFEAMFLFYTFSTYNVCTIYMPFIACCRWECEFNRLNLCSHQNAFLLM